jgi:PAS domain S-box-containing protein
MVQPDSRLFGPIMSVRGAIIAVMVVAYTIAWLLIPQSTQFAFMSSILAGEAILSAVVYHALYLRNKQLLVHLSLVFDTLASTGLILCTGYSGSPFPLFYLLILLAAGLLYGQSTGITYFLGVSLANLLAIGLDRLDPLMRNSPRQAGWAYVIMGASLPLVAVPMLLVFRLTQRGRYLEDLYENISDGLLILDELGRVVEGNGRVSEMTGRTRHELAGAPLESLVAVGEGGATIIPSQLQRCLSGESVSFELLFARDHKAPLPVEISAQMVWGVSPGRIQAFVRDISARRLMEAEIRRQNAELRGANQELQVSRDFALKASRLKSQFLANMSHELRTPLNSIIGYTQFVLDDAERPVAPDQKDDLGRVLRSARHLLELINGVLDLARIESGRESVSISRFDLRDLIDNVVDAVTPMAKGKGLALSCEIGSGPTELETDEKKLRQILLNLMANAIKFTERGTVAIDCAWDASNSIRVIVRDSGIGIPADQLDDIFNEFHQVDPSIHKHYGGTGLGLAIVRRLVELLNGTIQVSSTPGVGSTFTIVFPMILSSSHDTSNAPPIAPVPTPPADAEQPRQIGVVSDVTNPVGAHG